MANSMTLDMGPEQAVTAINEHNHTGGLGRSIPAEGLAANSVITEKIQNNAVTTPKIIDKAVVLSKLGDDVTALLNNASSSGTLGLTNYIANGMEVTAGTGLAVNVNPGRASISEKTQTLTAVTPLALSPRMASLVYAKKGTANAPEVGKIDAAYPEPDNNTVGQWRFNLNGDMTVPNYAVGKSSIAVANNLTPHGGLARVDGHCDYAVEGDGSTGYFTSANSTGFPVGAGTIHISLLYTHNVNVANQYICGYGSISATAGFHLQIVSGQIQFYSIATGFILDVGKTYLIDIGYDGTTLYLYVNGYLVYSSLMTLALTVSTLRLLCRSDNYYFNNSTIHYIELRNKMRTPAQIAQISNNLLLPCTYQSGGSIIPQMTSNSSSSVCIVSATNEFSTYLAYKAVDGVLGANGCIMIGSSNQIWTIDFLGISKNVKKVTLMPTTAETTRYPKNFTIEGWSDSAWVVAGTYTSITDWAINVQKDFYLSLRGNYTKYRVNITANNGDATYTEIGYIQMESEITTTDIRSILPASSISLGFARTNSTAVIEVDSDSYKYGIRQGVVNGNRRVFLGWKYFGVGRGVTWDIPFNTLNYRVELTAKIALSQGYSAATPNMAHSTSSGLGGLCPVLKTIDKYTIFVNGVGLIYNGVENVSGYMTTGYIGCYAEILEGDK